MTVTDDELLTRLAGLRIDHDTKEFYRGWLSRQLLLSRCESCGFWHQPPRPVCPACWSTDVTPTAVSGRGVVHLLIRLRQGPEMEGVDYTDGWPVVTVELEEQSGLRYTSTIVDADESIRIGIAVELAWIERLGAPYPVFRPRAAP
jgi:uncharacterized OB-fold protein